jgi:hypothetical protein
VAPRRFVILRTGGAGELSRAANCIRAIAQLILLLSTAGKSQLASRRDHFARSVLPSRRR